MNGPLSSRRSVLLGAPAVLAAPSALAQSLGQSVPMPGETQALEQLMTTTLEAQLGDAATARQLASTIAEAGFRWQYPQFPLRDADSVVAYSFGYRSATGKVDPNTGLSTGEEKPEPGPINEMLADAVHAICMARKVRVYAQWEIAEVLGKKYGLKDVVPIYPEAGADGKKTYLSTDGVAGAVVRLAGNAGTLGNVAVVGHRDHVKRCILVSRQHGMNAAAVREVPLPVHYDPESAQPWTRRRDAYLLSDVIAQLMMARTGLTSNAG
ncbi:hypothetical protein WBP07_23115 [Novosphingobium sp. BL-8A]|uniref:hypothetical protein n=1 Tax=Novosphingobium sp. BL-8A TaxID=3127639 RepID=UPI0037579382